MSIKVRLRVTAAEGGDDHKTINFMAVSTQVIAEDCKRDHGHAASCAEDCKDGHHVHSCKRKGEQFIPHDEHHAFYKQVPLGQMWLGNISPEEAKVFVKGKEFNVTFEEAPPATQPVE